MKHVTTGALALLLLASAGSALAQDAGSYNPAVRPSWRNNPANAGQPPAGAAPQAAPAEAPRGHSRDGNPIPQARGDQGHARDGSPRGAPDGRGERGPQAAPQQDGGRRGDNRPGDDRRGDDRRGGPDGRADRNWQGGGRHDDRNWQGGDRNWQGDRGRDWRPGRDERPRYDRRAYPNTWRPQQRFRGYSYRAPPGFYARRWSYGEILPRGWWGSEYRLNSWWDFGLPVPPIGYEWVRVGDDALLVDLYTGRVVQVAYDLFW